MVKEIVKRKEYAIVQATYDSRLIAIMTPLATVNQIKDELAKINYKGQVVMDFTLCIGMKPYRLVNTLFEKGELGLFRLTHYARVSKDTRNELVVYLCQNYIATQHNYGDIVKAYRENTAMFIQDYVTY